MMRVTHNPIGDPNTGRGYGSTRAGAPSRSYPAQDTYPYHTKMDPIPEPSDEDEHLADLVLSKIDSSTRARTATTGRTDRNTLTKGRFYLEENFEVHADTGIVPFPFQALYGHFSGPAVGGFRTDKAYTTRPGKNLKSTTRGWSMSPRFDPVGDKIGIHNIGDLIDPAMRSLAKSNLMIKLSLEDSE
jgi:hypothetical protein